MASEQVLRRTEGEVRQGADGGSDGVASFRTFDAARAPTTAEETPAQVLSHQPSAALSIRDLCRDAHSRAVRKGFYDPPPSVESRLCLIHSEVSEALEAYRDDAMTTILDPMTGKPEGLPSELADIVIRVCDFAQALGIDLEQEIRIKSNFNETRPAKHGRVRL